MKILIPTEPDDNHAVLVKLALEDVGHQVRLFFTADQPTRQKNSIYIDNHSYLWRSVDNYRSVMENDYDVVWWRRSRKPHIPRDKIHPDDYKFVVRENEFLYESLTNCMAPNAWWINPKAEATRSNSKLFQLKMAVECGLIIPTTLCSNDPKEIRSFMLKNESDGIIYKPLSAGIWFENQCVKLTYTAKINFSSIPANPLLQLTPGIFQKEIKKEFELRIVCFGDYIVAAKLHSQIHPEGETDWRAIPPGKMTLELYPLPIDIEHKIRLFMRKMGLVFGSLDFIVTHDGDHIFLELNEQGQFLWLEAYCHDMKMLDIFIHFILNQSIEFKWNEDKAILCIDTYQHDAQSIMNENLRRHVDFNTMITH